MGTEKQQHIVGNTCTYISTGYAVDRTEKYIYRLATGLLCGRRYERTQTHTDTRASRLPTTTSPILIQFSLVLSKIFSHHLQTESGFAEKGKTPAHQFNVQCEHCRSFGCSRSSAIAPATANGSGEFTSTIGQSQPKQFDTYKFHTKSVATIEFSDPGSWSFGIASTPKFTDTTESNSTPFN